MKKNKDAKIDKNKVNPKEKIEHLHAGIDEVTPIKGRAGGQQVKTDNEDQIPVNDGCDDPTNDDALAHEKTSFSFM